MDSNCRSRSFSGERGRFRPVSVLYPALNGAAVGGGVQGHRDSLIGTAVLRAESADKGERSTALRSGL